MSIGKFPSEEDHVTDSHLQKETSGDELFVWSEIPYIFRNVTNCHEGQTPLPFPWNLSISRRQMVPSGTCHLGEADRPTF